MAQMRELASYQTFGVFANRPALDLAERLADLAPLDDPRIFLGSGGGDAIDTAAKLARRYFAAIGTPERTHLISRSQGYHGTHGMGTSIGGIPANRQDVGPLDPDASVVPLRLARGARGRDRARRRRPRRRRLRRAGHRRRRRAPAGARLHRGRRRAVRAHRRALRLRLGHRRLRAPGDVVRHRALGRAPRHAHLRQGRDQRLPAARRRRRRRARSRRPSGRTAPGSATGPTYSGHPTVCAAAMANLDIIEREGLLDRGRELEDEIAPALPPARRPPAGGRDPHRDRRPGRDRLRRRGAGRGARPARRGCSPRCASAASSCARWATGWPSRRRWSSRARRSSTSPRSRARRWRRWRATCRRRWGRGSALRARLRRCAALTASSRGRGVGGGRRARGSARSDACPNLPQLPLGNRAESRGSSRRTTARAPHPPGRPSPR